MRFMYTFPPSVHVFCCSIIGGLIVGIYKRSQIHEFRNWERGRAVSFLGIFVSNFRFSVFAVRSGSIPPSAIASLFLAYEEYFPSFLSCQGVVRPAPDVPHTRHGVITAGRHFVLQGALIGRRGRGQAIKTGVRREKSRILFFLAFRSGRA
jgi:hypothetical protein